REAGPDARDVHRDRPGAPAAGEMRVRSGPAAQPRQGFPDAAPLRGAWADACPWRAGTVPRPAAFLTVTDNPAPQSVDDISAAVAQAAATGDALEVRGGGTKAAI